MPRNSTVVRPILTSPRSYFFLILAFCAIALVLPTGMIKRANADKAPFEFWGDDEESENEARESHGESAADRDHEQEEEREESEARDYLGRRKFRSEEEREMLLAASPDDGAREIRFRAVNTLERLRKVVIQNSSNEPATFAVAAAATISPGNPTINFTGGPFLIPTNAQR